MPWTFSHPLAVVGMRRFCPDPLNFAALVIGSMSPDFGYYFRQFGVARFAHTVLGTFAVCLPAGLIAVAIFYLLRQPLCFLLPQPHRTALMPLARRAPVFSFSTFATTAGCVLLGAWTHTFWDSFTHDGGWAVQRFAVLRLAIIQVGSATLPLSYILQQASTFGAGAFLAILYWRWLSRQRKTSVPVASSFPDLWRYIVLGVLFALAVAFAVPAALRAASAFDGYLAFRVFFFRVAVYTAAVFVPLLLLAAIGLYVVHQRRA